MSSMEQQQRPQQQPQAQHPQQVQQPRVQSLPTMPVVGMPSPLTLALASVPVVATTGTTSAVGSTTSTGAVGGGLPMASVAAARTAPPVATPPSSSSSSSKRLLASRDGKQLSEKKLRRLEKNRLSARECRRRKREATENLERQINVLEGENLRLRLQLQIGKEAEESRSKEQTKVTDELDRLLRSGASESEIYARIEEFKEKFADYGRDRRSAMEFHFRNIERLLMPTTTTSVAMTALQNSSSSPMECTSNGSVGGGVVHQRESNGNEKTPQPMTTENGSSSTSTVQTTSPIVPSNTTTTTTEKSSLSPSLDPKAMFAHLVEQLGVTEQQAAALKDSRWVAKELDDMLRQALGLLAELRQRLSEIGEDLESEFGSVRAILTPTQSAKFLVWVKNNPACMHMLDELWNRVYTLEEEEESDVNNNKKNHKSNGEGTTTTLAAAAASSSTTTTATSTMNGENGKRSVSLDTKPQAKPTG